MLTGAFMWYHSRQFGEMEKWQPLEVVAAEGTEYIAEFPLLSKSVEMPPTNWECVQNGGTVLAQLRKELPR